MLITKWFHVSTIKQRVLILPILGILSLIFITGINWYLNKQKGKDIQVGEKANSVIQDVLNMMLIEERFMKTHQQEYLLEFEKYKEEFETYVAGIGRFTKDTALINRINSVGRLGKENWLTFNKISYNIRKMDVLKEELNSKQKRTDKLLKTILKTIDQEEANLIMEGELLDSTKSSLRKELMDFIHHQTEKMMNLQDLLLFSDFKGYIKRRGDIEKSLDLKAGNISTLLDNIGSEEFMKNWQEARRLMSDMRKIEDKLYNRWKSNMELLPALDASSMKIQKIANEVIELSNLKIKEVNRLNNLIAVIASIVFFMLLSLISFFTVRSISSVLEANIAKLDEGADQVSGAADQVSSTSQFLAEGASEQAASIEETSSSLEQVSSMTKQNADNAAHAERLMSEVSIVVQKADESMDRLTDAMNSISNASNETRKIIKTIDEIAFQTNLLALNAAVEAARAGEAGAGFAVVADEVRTLAMRAADAAKSTAEIIEKTVKDVGDGAELVKHTNDAFSEVTESISKVENLLREISTASSEQAHEIDQISKAVAEMDKVIQRTASNAEEAASASEQLSAQAKETKTVVKSLISLVGGNISKVNGSHKQVNGVTQKMMIEGTHMSVTQQDRKPLPRI